MKSVVFFNQLRKGLFQLQTIFFPGLPKDLRPIGPVLMGLQGKSVISNSLDMLDPFVPVLINFLNVDFISSKFAADVTVDGLNGGIEYNTL